MCCPGQKLVSKAEEIAASTILLTLPQTLATSRTEESGEGKASPPQNDVPEVRLDAPNSQSQKGRK
jgi:hypothetical protein